MDWTEMWNTPWIGALAGAVVVLVVLLVALRRRGRRTLPYMRQPAVLSADQRHLYAALCTVAGADIDVWPRLGATDVLGVRPSAGRRLRRRARRRIEHERFDFVLCARADSRPLAAVRLEPHTPRASERRRAAALAAACEAAGLGLVRLAARPPYDTAALREELQPWLEAPSADAVDTAGPGDRREPIIDLPPD